MPNMRRYITLLILSAATLLQAQTVKSVRLVEDAAGNDRHTPSYEVTYEMHIYGAQNEAYRRERG